MNSVKDIEKAICQLSAEDRVAFRAWYLEYDAREWDRQIDADMANGRLDWLVNEAKEARQAKNCTDR